MKANGLGTLTLVFLVGDNCVRAQHADVVDPATLTFSFVLNNGRIGSGRPAKTASLLLTDFGPHGSFFTIGPGSKNELIESLVLQGGLRLQE